MSNTILEDKIKALSADYIYQQSVGSLLLLLLSAMEEEEKTLAYEIPEDVLKIQSEIRKHMLNLEDILGDEDQRLSTLEQAVALKKQLLEVYGVVYSYFSQWNVISTVISDQIAIRKYKEDMSSKDVDWSLFLADCHAFLENASSLQDQDRYKGQLLKCIPLFMARDKFYQQISNSLHVAFENESSEYIKSSLQAFESFCCPETNENYGKYFAEIAEFLGAKRLALPHKMDDPELDELYQSMGEFFECLEDIEEYFSCIFHDINSLILLCSLSYTFEDLTEKDVSYGDLYHSVCNFINGEWSEVEKSAYKDTLLEQLDTAIEPVIDKAQELAKKEIQLLEKVTTFADFSDDTKKILMTEEFIRECFFGDLNSALFDFATPNTEQEIATAQERADLFQSFLTHTRNSFDTLPAQTRKVAMQTLMGALPPIYSVQEVMDSIQEAIDTLSTAEQKMLLVDKIGTVFQQNGYDSLVNEEPHHHHHH